MISRRLFMGAVVVAAAPALSQRLIAKDLRSVGELVVLSEEVAFDPENRWWVMRWAVTRDGKNAYSAAVVRDPHDLKQRELARTAMRECANTFFNQKQKEAQS